MIGAGGHGKVVVATLTAAGYRILGLLDDEPSKWNRKVLDLPVLGAITEVEHVTLPRAVIAIGDNHSRKKVAERLKNVDWISVVHPAALVHPSVRLGAGTVVFAGAVIQADSTIGLHCIINTSASVDHDCMLGDFTHVAPGAHLGGNVELGEGVFLGIGSAVIPAKRVGHWTVVGAGGVVTAELGPNVIAVGIPARPVER